ncbi:MAG: hypothetical protein M1816_001594 [Peltula sp. TS41687]|nr:MAG: hypothetical protein M1816_001594 [Peltula sp. TS41687]
MLEKDLPRVPAILSLTASFPISQYTYNNVYGSPLRGLALATDEKDLEAFRANCPKEWYPDHAPMDRRPTIMRSMTSRSSMSMSDGLRSAATMRDDEFLLGRHTREQARVCGLRRRVFYVLLAFALLLVIGLVVGLTVGLTVVKSPHDEEYPGAAPAHIDVPKPPSQVGGSSSSTGDPLPGTAFATLAYTQGTGSAASNQQSFRIYYQEVGGAIQEMQYESSVGAWANSTSIINEARKNSGVAAFTYLSNSERTNFVLYVDNNNMLQGSRKLPSSKDWVLSTQLQDLKVQVNGLTANEEDNGRLRLAAVYSEDFSTGPGARVFYHAPPDDKNKDGYVQELIWDQRSDAWSLGAKVTDPLPTSALAATIDGQSLRLFYSTGSGTLQESWLNIADAKASYKRGMKKEKLLSHDDTAISALTVSGSALVYHHDRRSGIRELDIFGAPNSPGQKVTLNPSTVATADSQRYMSVGALVGASPDGSQKIHVLHSALPGSEGQGTTDLVIMDRTRDIKEKSWPTSLRADMNVRLPTHPKT